MKISMHFHCQLSKFRVNFIKPHSLWSVCHKMLWMPLWAGSTVARGQEGSTEVIGYFVSGNKGDDNLQIS
jgi:hypothetical protein